MSNLFLIFKGAKRIFEKCFFKRYGLEIPLASPFKKGTREDFPFLRGARGISKISKSHR
jgi:hypothetical protein